MARKKKESAPAFINSSLNNPMRNYAVYEMKPLERAIATAISFVLGGFVGTYVLFSIFCMHDSVEKVYD